MKLDLDMPEAYAATGELEYLAKKKFEDKFVKDKT